MIISQGHGRRLPSVLLSAIRQDFYAKRVAWRQPLLRCARPRAASVNEARCSNKLLEHLEHLHETNDLFGNVAKSRFDKVNWTASNGGVPFGRDDKGEGEASMESGCWTEGVFITLGRPRVGRDDKGVLVELHFSSRCTALHSSTNLSSRPERSVVERSAVSFNSQADSSARTLA